MKKLFLFLTLLLCFSSFAQDVWVNGYYRKSGTYVQGHYRTKPDGILSNNYSYRDKSINTPKSPNYNYSTSSYIPPTTVQPLYSPPITSSIPEEYKMTPEKLAKIYQPDKSDVKVFKGGRYFMNNNGTKNYVVKTLSR